MDDLVKRLIEANENGVQGCLGSDIFYLSAERIDFLNKKLEQSQQRVKELVSAINTINRSKHHEVPESITGDDEPCYWQRKEWVDWILELANEADDLDACGSESCEAF